MGSCTLTFEQMQLLNQKSDTDHRDNDWITIIWAINGEVMPHQTFPLLNDRGDSVLKSGDLIPRFESSVACADNDLVSVTFSIVNLGSTDLKEQPDAANQIAKEIAQKVTEVYIEIAKVVLKSPISGSMGGPILTGLSMLANYALEALGGDIVKGVGLVFDKIIGPLLDDLVDLYSSIIGKPYCNGDILNDTAVFLPGQPDAPITIAKVYTASEASGCGAPAATDVHLTLSRQIEVVPGFASGPAPKVDANGATKKPLDSWIGTWAEDPQTPTPIIKCFISRSPVMRAARGIKTLDVSIIEEVDRRYGAQFNAKAFKLTPKAVTVFPFTSDVFGHLLPWHNHLKPGNLTVRMFPRQSSGKMIRSKRAGQKNAPKKTPALTPVFRLAWQNETADRVGFASSARAPVAGSGTFSETADSIFLPEDGVRLTLYEIKQGEVHIAYWVRYQRDATALFSAADVMLTQWTPGH